MKDKIRPGVVLAQVCGESLLVATRPARGFCPYVKQLNSTGAFFWTLLEQGLNPEEMAQAALEEYKVPVERLRPGLARFLEDLRRNGYLIQEEA